jgi:hypothetical protein
MAEELNLKTICIHFAKNYLCKNVLDLALYYWHNYRIKAWLFPEM